MRRAKTNGAEKVDSWWASTARPAPARPMLAGEVTADVAVLGGGYTGLWTALSLAERGYKVALLEARTVGWAASGRNGGQIVTAFNPTMATIGQWVGAEDARRLWDLSEEAKRLLADTIARHRIDCDLTWGYVFAGLRPRHEAALRTMAEEWAGYGYRQTRPMGREEVRAHIGSPRYTCGLYDAGGGHLHPLNYARGLADACERAGVVIYENSPVTALDTGASPSMSTGQGRVKAKFLVLGGNALLGRLVPSIRSQIAPVATYIAATERLGRARIRSVLADDIAVSDMNFVLNYFRRTPDHRLLFGAGVSYSGIDPVNLRATIRRAMLKVFPQLGDVRFDQCWGGLVDISMNRAPHLGRLSPTAYFAQGFSGHGVAHTAICGKVIAEAIAGQAERFDVFAKVPHARFPGGPMRIPSLVLAMTWYRLRDLI